MPTICSCQVIVQRSPSSVAEAELIQGSGIFMHRLGLEHIAIVDITADEGVGDGSPTERSATSRLER